MVARLEGARRRLASEHDGRAWLAWHVAALSRAERLPDLGSLLFDNQKPTGPMSPEAQIGAIDSLFLAWGGDPAELARVRAEREL